MYTCTHACLHTYRVIITYNMLLSISIYVCTYTIQSSSEYYYTTRCLYPYAYSTDSHMETNMTDDESEEVWKKLNVKTFKWPKGLNSSNLPSDVDWRTMGAVSQVKDQV